MRFVRAMCVIGLGAMLVSLPVAADTLGYKLAAGQATYTSTSAGQVIPVSIYLELNGAAAFPSAYGLVAAGFSVTPTAGTSADLSSIDPPASLAATLGAGLGVITSDTATGITQEVWGFTDPPTYSVSAYQGADGFGRVLLGTYTYASHAPNGATQTFTISDLATPDFDWLMDPVSLATVGLDHDANLSPFANIASGSFQITNNFTTGAAVPLPAAAWSGAAMLGIIGLRRMVRKSQVPAK